MLRTAVQPRWLALLAALIVVLISFTQLGLWQLSRASQGDAQERLAAQEEQAPVPLTSLITPFEPFPEDGSNRPVQTSGTYDPELQFLVPNRLLNGIEGLWVVTGLRTQDGGVLPVLRGWVATSEAADVPDSGPRTVTGTLAPSESALPDQLSAGLPEGQLGSIELATLANTWSGDLYNAFIFATDTQPAMDTQVVPVPPPSLADEGLNWLNLGYALQWWVFAGFAIYMYWRFLHQAAYPPVVKDPEPRPTVAT